MVTAASRDVMPGFAFNDAFPNLSNGVAAAVAETGVCYPILPFYDPYPYPYSLCISKTPSS
jgi:hypothetical protein